jgi:beta-RFAP synthase
MAEGDPREQVEVVAPARLHLGFLDLHGGLGRRFGSIGLTVEEPCLHLRMRRSRALLVTGPDPERARRALQAAAAALGVPSGVELAVDQAIPPHVGLGSGTQLGLAVATALARLNGRELDFPALAQAAGRGARSGIGIGAFERGGFLIDGGRGPADAPAPVVARLPLPPGWRVLLILDGTRSGLHGPAESAAFQTLPPFPEELAGRICRLLLMRLLPALAEADFPPFAAALGEIQDRLGDYFAAAQNGRYSSPLVSRAIEWLRARGVTGLGQTSWGPTGFAFFASTAEAEARCAALRAGAAGRQKGLHGPGDWRNLDFRIVAGRNRGADVVWRPREGEDEP